MTTTVGSESEPSVGSDDTQKFADDPSQFATSNTISTQHLGKPGRLPAQGHAHLVKVGLELYEVEYIDLSNNNLASSRSSSVPAYFLGYNGPDPRNSAPAYVDIPKRAAEGCFLFTGALSGCSVVVTDLDLNTYRVYHDGRTNSSLLYDKVSMAVDYKDYQMPGAVYALAVVYMQYVKDEWQLVLQRHDFEKNDKGGIRLKVRSVMQPLSIYRANDKTMEQRQAEFASYREQVHERLKKAAGQFDVPVEGVADGLYIDGGFSYENSAIAAWISLRKKVEARVAEAIEKIKSEKDTLFEQQSSALNDEKMRLLSLTHEHYRAQYHTLLKEVLDVEHLWLWQQIKVKEGISAVLRSEDASSHVLPVHTKSLAERYEISEAALREAQNSDFIEGESTFRDINIPGVDDEMSAMEMKKLFVESQLTPREQGALSALIVQTSKDEHLNKVLSHVKLYSDEFQRAGSGFQRLVPQDLFLLQVGDQSGGRCYPLVRAMAVALACDGENGVDRLVKKLQVATADPQVRNSMLLKNSLITLHSNIYAVQASTQRGKFALDEVVSRLQNMSKTSMFALNTQWHAMMVGSVVADKRSRYYFYDPNVGIFAFDNVTNLTQAMHKYLVVHGLAAYYGSFGRQSAPAFNLIEIDTAKMAEAPIGLGLIVADLSQSDELESVSEIRQQAEQTVKIHMRVTEDLQLRMALATLDVERWGSRFYDASTQLAKKSGLNSRWVPVIDNTHDQGEGRYRIQFINRDKPENTRWVYTDDSTFSKYCRFVDQHMHALSQHFTFEHGQLQPKGVAGEAAPIDGLNAGFEVQALIQWFAHKSRQDALNETSSPELATLLRIHGYVNSIQMAHGSVKDVSQVIEQIATVLRSKEKVAESFVSALGHSLNEGAGVLFGEVLVGLDAYELAYADNDTQKAVFGTQLAFDSASLVTGIAGVTAGLVGASTAAAMLSSSGVILGGLGVGFIALAQAFSAVAEDAKAVGRYFDMVDTAYKGKGYRYDDKQQVLVPLAGAVVRCLDLSRGQIDFDSQYIYSTEYAWIGDLPQNDRNRDHAIEVRSGIGYGVTPQQLEHSKSKRVILPGTPKSYISHDYGLLPFATGRHDTGFNVIRRLESERFSFAFYIFPGERIIRVIHQEYVETKITVVLDQSSRQLLVPRLPKELYGYLNYTFKGGGGSYLIELNKGVYVHLVKSTPSNWIIDTHQLDSDAISFMDYLYETDGIAVVYYRLRIGGVIVDIDSEHANEIRVIKHNREEHRVNFATKTSQVERVNASKWLAVGLSVEQHLQDLAKAHQLQGQFVVVENYRHNTRDVGRAFYDVTKNRMLFTDTPDELAKNAQLGAVMDSHAYFYNAEHAVAWRVIIISGQVDGQFNPLASPHGTQAIRLWQESDAVYLSSYHLSGKSQTEEVYQILSDRMELVRVIGDDALLRTLLGVTSGNILSSYNPGTPTHRLGRLIEPTAAELMMVYGTDTDGVNHRYWILAPNNIVVKPNLEPPQSHSQQLEICNLERSAWPIPNDLMLVGSMFRSGGEEVFFFYSKEQKVLFRQEGLGQTVLDASSPSAERVATPPLANVVNISGNLIVITNDGCVASVNALGRLSYEAVNEHWLKGRTTWLQDLASVAGSSTTVSVFGVKGADGKSVLPVWYRGGQVVVASALLQGKLLQFLGFEADGATARLFEPDSGKLYFQRTMTRDELVAAFGEDAMLKTSAHISVAVELAPEQRFKAAEQVDVGLRLTTVNGEILLRTNNGELQLIAVDADWLLDTEVFNSWWQWLAFDAEPQVKYCYRLPEALASLAKQWDAKGVLTLQGYGAQVWFDIDSGQIFSSSGIKAVDNLRFIGIAVGQKAAYVYSLTSQALYRITESAPQILTEFTGVKRVGSSLVLQGAGDNLNPLILTGADSLVLCGNIYTYVYDLGKEVWKQYCTVVIDLSDRTTGMTEIRLSMIDPKEILVSRYDDDLMLIHAHTGSVLVVRQAFSQVMDNLLIVLANTKFEVLIGYLVKSFIKMHYIHGGLVALSWISKQ